MKKMLKSYFVFAPVSYRVVWLILVPLLQIGAEVLVGWIGFFALCAIVLGYIVITEVLSDWFFLGGFCAEKGGVVKCVHTSTEGRRLLRDVLCMDLVRKFLYSVLYGAVCAGMTGDCLGILAGILLYLVAAAVLNGSRYVSVFQMHLLLAMAACVVYSILLGGGWMAVTAAGESAPRVLAALSLLALAAAAVLSAATVKHMLRRAGLEKHTAVRAAEGEEMLCARAAQKWRKK